jgi:hypothetical protein
MGNVCSTFYHRENKWIMMKPIKVGLLIEFSPDSAGAEGLCPALLCVFATAESEFKRAAALQLESISGQFEKSYPQRGWASAEAVTWLSKKRGGNAPSFFTICDGRSRLFLHVTLAAIFGIFSSKGLSTIMTGAAVLSFVDVGHLHLPGESEFFHFKQFWLDVTIRARKLFLRYVKLMAKSNRRGRLGVLIRKIRRHLCKHTPLTGPETDQKKHRQPSHRY